MSDVPPGDDDRWPPDVGLRVVGGRPRPPDVERLVRAVARGHGSSDLGVAAVLAWKRYAYTVAAPVLAAWVRHGVVPDVHLDNAVITVREEDPLIEVAVVAARVSPAGTELAAALEPLRQGHLAAVRGRFRAHTAIGGRTFDVLEAATLTSALAAAAPPGRSFGAVAELLDVLGPSAARLVEVAELWRDERTRRPFALRSACCLAYRVEPDRYCPSCNLIDDERRTADLAAQGLSWRRVVAGD